MYYAYTLHTFILTYMHKHTHIIFSVEVPSARLFHSVDNLITSIMTRPVSIYTYTYTYTHTHESLAYSSEHASNGPSHLHPLSYSIQFLPRFEISIY